MRDGFSTKNVCLPLLQKRAKREGIIINIYEINASLSSPPLYTVFNKSLN